MTLQECINRVDNAKPNHYATEDKVMWLSYLDGSIKKTVIDLHEHKGEDGFDIELPEFRPYSPDRLTDELLVKFPYDEMYVDYLKAKIDEENGETARYNNTASTFNMKLQEFTQAYHREHLPLSKNFQKYI